MKKFLLLTTAALFAFCSCQEKVEEEQTTPQDTLELSAKEAVFTKDAGTAKVMVTSSASWKLTSEMDYDWVTPSATEGEDGDVVEFSVLENLASDRTAVYTFTCGTASQNYSIVSIAGEAPQLVLTSDAEIVKDFKSGIITITATVPTGYRSLSVTVAEDAQTWLHYRTILSGDTENDAEVKIEYDQLEGLAAREALITLTAEGFEPLTVNFKQTPEPTLRTDQEFYNAPVTAGNLVVPFQANVEYEVNIPEDCTSWLKYESTSEEGLVFHVDALESGKRSARIEVRQKNTPAGQETLVAEFTITQAATVIEWAADMTNNRLFPKWTTYAPSSAAQQVTLEAMIYANELITSSKEISTVMGVEGQFLLRFGDAGLQGNILQIATIDGNVELSDYPFETKRWYHLAVTFDSGHIVVYRDGEVLYDGRCGAWCVPLGNKWSYEPNGNRCWWYGYSYNNARYFNGMMTELRIWSKVLTSEEINAPGHFYEVDPASEGLSCYWKFTEGQGDTIADKATNRGSAITEPLYGETDIEEQYDGRDGLVNKGTPGIKWVKVALPDK